MLKYNEPLSNHTSFCIGGPAYCWADTDSVEDIREAINLAEDKNKKFVIIGRGTNLLVKDEGFDGIVIRLGSGFEKIEIKSVTSKNVLLKIYAGLSVAKLVRYALDNSFGGCEFLTGIPGSFGGAVFMNAGVRGAEDASGFSEIKDLISDIDVLDLRDSKVKTIAKEGIGFKYRSSGLDNKIILSGSVLLKKDEKENICHRIEGFNKKRDWLSKIGFPNAGSVFKNPAPDKPAGRLIESCGLKGKRIGNAEISMAHANIILNLGKAAAKDVLALIDLARTAVRDNFGIDLELELKIL